MKRKNLWMSTDTGVCALTIRDLLRNLIWIHDGKIHLFLKWKRMRYDPIMRTWVGRGYHMIALP